MEGWSDCLRFELEPFGIDVTLIEPGLIATEFNDVVSTTVPPKSMNGPYKELVDAVARVAENGLSSSAPSVIAHTILKAIKSNRPRNRYVVGSMARPLIFIRR